MVVVPHLNGHEELILRRRRRGVVVLVHVGLPGKRDRHRLEHRVRLPRGEPDGVRHHAGPVAAHDDRGEQVDADGEGAVSAEAVKAQIRALCDAEDPADVLSDDQLVDLLRDKGFDLARRTVAKYREAIGIGSSVQRRRQKKLARVA